MTSSIDKRKGPGVYLPPPLIYVAVFMAAVFIQKRVALPSGFLHSKFAMLVGILFLISAAIVLFASLRQFFLTKNTVILIRPATSLQKTGIYAVTRNPMYLGLALVYSGVTCLAGNLWNIILFPVLIIIVDQFIIRKEERYLELEFGDEYHAYKSKVRKWI